MKTKTTKTTPLAQSIVNWTVIIVIFGAAIIIIGGSIKSPVYTHTATGLVTDKKYANHTNHTNHTTAKQRQHKSYIKIQIENNSNYIRVSSELYNDIRIGDFIQVKYQNPRFFGRINITKIIN